MKTAAELRRDVLAELEWEPSVDERSIGVSVSGGVVTLTGRITSYAEGRAAVRAAERLAGVQGVVNELAVEPADDSRPDDEAIAEAAVKALRWHARVPEGSVKPIVSDGWMTLEGEVDRRYQKELAYRAVRDLAGVRGIVNQIRVRPVPRVQEIRGKIAEALHRSATVDARAITVRTVGDRVILSGRVRSWAEAEDAARSAWAAPGVRVVENRLRVEPHATALLGPGTQPPEPRQEPARSHDMADRYGSIAL